jgi:hypothetical protein
MNTPADWQWKCGITIAVLTLLIFILIGLALNAAGVIGAGKKSLNDMQGQGGFSELMTSMEVMLFVSVFLAYQFNRMWFTCY